MDKVKRLEKYASDLKDRLKVEVLDEQKRLFLERDLRKTLATLESIKK